MLVHIVNNLHKHVIVIRMCPTTFVFFTDPCSEYPLIFFVFFHQGIVQASFWGLGFGGGSIIGGFSFRVFGERETFRGFAVASFTVLVFFIIIQFILTSAEKQEEGSKYQALSNKEEISQSKSPTSEEDHE